MPLSPDKKQTIPTDDALAIRAGVVRAKRDIDLINRAYAKAIGQPAQKNMFVSVMDGSMFDPALEEKKAVVQTNQILSHAIKGIYALAIAWVIVAVINSKPWGSQQHQPQPVVSDRSEVVVQQPVQQSPSDIYPDDLKEDGPIDPRVQQYVGWVRTWDVATTAEWVSWCLRNNDGLNGPDDRGELICKALKVK